MLNRSCLRLLRSGISRSAPRTNNMQLLWETHGFGFDSQFNSASESARCLIGFFTHDSHSAKSAGVRPIARPSFFNQFDQLDQWRSNGILPARIALSFAPSFRIYLSYCLVSIFNLKIYWINICVLISLLFVSVGISGGDCCSTLQSRSSSSVLAMCEQICANNARRKGVSKRRFSKPTWV